MGGSSRIIELDEAAAFAAARRVTGAALIYVAPAGSGDTEGIARFLEALAERYAGRLACGRLDREAAPTFARVYAITPAPTLLLVRRGQVIHRLVGMSFPDPMAPALRFLIEQSLEAA
jgi:thioredoxin-like negative regulator of GroEL